MGQVRAGCGGTQGKSWGQQAEGSGPRSQPAGAAGGGCGQGLTWGPGPLRQPPRRPCSLLGGERWRCLHSLTADPPPCHPTPVVHGNFSGEPWACRGSPSGQPGVRARNLSSPSHLLPLSHTHSGPRSSPAHQSQNCHKTLPGALQEGPPQSCGQCWRWEPRGPRSMAPTPWGTRLHPTLLGSLLRCVQTGWAPRGGERLAVGSRDRALPEWSPSCSSRSRGGRRPRAWLSSVLAGNPARLTPHFSTDTDQTSSCFLP